MTSEEKLILIFQQLRKELGDDIKLNYRNDTYYLEVGKVIWSKKALEIIKGNHIRVI